MQVALLLTFHAHLSGLEEPPCSCQSPFVGVLVERLVQGEKLTTEILRVHLACRLDAAALQSCLSLHRCYIPNGCCSSREVTGCLTVVLLLIISVSGSIRSLWVQIFSAGVILSESFMFLPPWLSN